MTKCIYCGQVHVLELCIENEEIKDDVLNLIGSREYPEDYDSRLTFGFAVLAGFTDNDL